MLPLHMTLYGKFLFLFWRSTLTCCEEDPVAVGSEVRWRCGPAAWATASPGAVGRRTAPGATHPVPAGKRAPAPVPPEPPVGPAGRLGEQPNARVRTPLVRFELLKLKQLCCCPCLRYRIPWKCRWWGGWVRRGSVRHSVADREPGSHQCSLSLEETQKSSWVSATFYQQTFMFSI